MTTNKTYAMDLEKKVFEEARKDRRTKIYIGKVMRENGIAASDVDLMAGVFIRDKSTGRIYNLDGFCMTD